MTIDALGGATALASIPTDHSRPARDVARVQSPEKTPEQAEKDTAPTTATAPVERVEKDPEDQLSQETASVTDIAKSAAENARNDHATRLSILYDRDIDQFISRRVDPGSGEVVRQFPYEEQIERIRLFTELNRDDDDERLDLRI